MIAHSIKGGAGVTLRADEAGNPKGRPIVFLHGATASRLVWDPQMTSTLANDFRQDRQAMKDGNFTGIEGIPNQDMAMWTSMGRIVPSPTCRVANAQSMPRSRSLSKRPGVKCRPAVGAATAPGSRP